MNRNKVVFLLRDAVRAKARVWDVIMAVEKEFGCDFDGLEDRIDDVTTCDMEQEHVILGMIDNLIDELIEDAKELKDESSETRQGSG